MNQQTQETLCKLINTELAHYRERAINAILHDQPASAIHFLQCMRGVQLLMEAMLKKEIGDEDPVELPGIIHGEHSGDPLE